MRVSRIVGLGLAGLLVALSTAGAQMTDSREQSGAAAVIGGWEPRQAWKPDPSKVRVPEGYKVEVFVGGLDSPSSVAVDKQGNVWAAISGNLFGPFGDIRPGKQQAKRPFSKPKVMVFDRNGKHIATHGEGVFEYVLAEIGFNPENGKIYIPEYGRRIWEIDGVNGQMRVVIDDLPRGDHMNGGLEFKDGYIYWGQGLPSNTGFSDPDNHGWVDEVDPFWEKHGDPKLPKTARDPACRDFVHTGLNVKSADGRMTGAFLPAGVPAQPGMIIKATVPCGGSIMRAKLSDRGPDGKIPHDKMEVYAMGFRNQHGLAFGPKGTKFENALAVTDNGANDLGHRRIANDGEKLFIVTQKGQDAGFPDKGGFGFMTTKRYGWHYYNRAVIERPYPQLYIGDKPYTPPTYPYRFPSHVDGTRGVPLIMANPNPNGYINAVLEWDTNNPMDGIAWSTNEAFAPKNTLFAAVFGIIDNGPESLVPTWPAILRIEFLEPAGVKWSYFMRNVDMGPNAYQKPENRGGLERTNDVTFNADGTIMYVADYGELFTDFTKASPFYQTAGTGTIWKVTRAQRTAQQ
jgi:glucose/arabinose dehydrogenase